jgi:DNA-binding NarL/FixJ family response regulator
VTADVDRQELRQIIAGPSRGLIEERANLRSSDANRPDAHVGDLPARVRQILNSVCSDLDDGAFARNRDPSRKTVRDHAATLDRKIGVPMRGEAVIWGGDRFFLAPLRNKMIDLPVCFAH